MTETPKAKGRDYGRILAVLRAVGRPLCPHEFDQILAIDYIDALPGLYRDHSMRQYVGCTEATLARRLRKAARLGLVVTSKRQAGNGVWLTQYSLPKTAPNIAPEPRLESTAAHGAPHVV